VAASEPERVQFYHEVKALLSELSSIDATSLGRRQELSPDINFEEIVPNFQVMLDFVRQLNERDLSRLPHAELAQLRTGLNSLRAHIQQVREFTLTQDSPVTQRNTICENVRNSYDKVVRPLLLPLAFTSTQAADFAKLALEAQELHAKLREEAASFAASLQAMTSDAHLSLAAIKQQAADAGVSVHSQIYSEQADRHAATAKWWFAATIVATVATFVAAVLGLVLAVVYTPPDVPSALQYIVAKLIVISVLSFSVIWCSRNYRAEKHNETLNRHRANSLGTFRTFMEGAQDKATKEAILLFCANSAFGHRPSGYDKEDGGEVPPQIVNPLVELVGKQVSQS
jgi:hypothetical protein